ncbi:fasciclin-like arabinogalactan protein 4 [Actinidia eriantha]|uniref:fasciclin-like arabinogalactan protein 4 n=1 Tax=Actinidia eriantha TaxID=165200 RepID=UPI00258D1577|nr:fasciclin-like arabinogalactan protein 4 [Actinidia eriantha]
MATSSNPHFTHTAFLYFLLFAYSSTPIFAINITHLLSPYPDLSAFTQLLTTTSVAADLDHRSSLTLLVVPNSDLTLHRPLPSSATTLADALRYHVLLEYLSWTDLRSAPAAGKLVITLYQSTGRASSDFGSVNITRDPTTGAIAVRSPSAAATAYSPSNATVISLIKSLPYNVTIFSVNSLLIPSGSDLTASETRPPLGLNITKALIDGHNFNVAATMLAASGVDDEFERDEGGAGITLFVPTDDAFSDLPSASRFQSLPADKKAVVLRFHVLHSYYPLGSLESIVNPVQPTLATEQMGAGSFTLNISRGNESVAIDTGIVQATVTRTVFDENPVAIFGVSRVLLPKEIFGANSMGTRKPGSEISDGAQLPELSLSPENSPELDGPASLVSSPPGFHVEIRSAASGNVVQRLILGIFCTGLYLLVCD